ncbi:MAG: potassium channel family protein [Halanaerobiales bacterium]
MYIIVIGCGKIGSMLANMLSRENHNVVVIDRDSENFSSLASDFTGITIEGNGIDEDVLESAGIEKAEALLAVTDDDNSNIMASQIAARFFAVDNVISRLDNPSREFLLQDSGIEVINTIKLSAFSVRNKLLNSSFQRFNIDVDNEIEIVTFQVGELSGKSPAELEFNAGDTSILGIIREGNVYQINEINKLKTDDKLILSPGENAYEEFIDLKGGYEA